MLFRSDRPPTTDTRRRILSSRNDVHVTSLPQACVPRCPRLRDQHCLDTRNFLRRDQSSRACPTHHLAKVGLTERNREANALAKPGQLAPNFIGPSGCGSQDHHTSDNTSRHLKRHASQAPMSRNDQTRCVWQHRTGPWGPDGSFLNPKLTPTIQHEGAEAPSGAQQCERANLLSIPKLVVQLDQSVPSTLSTLHLGGG